MSEDGDTRSQLEARVYSRAGADEPRTEHVDPATGRIIRVTESEWRLLQADRAQGERDPTAVPVADAAEAVSPPPSAATADSAVLRRRFVITPLRGALLGFAVGAALVGAWVLIGETVRHAPSVEVAITPTPSADLAGVEGLPSAAALDAFRDPAMLERSLPVWLRGVFPRSRVAELIGPDEEIPGAMAYAVLPSDTFACIIVPLEPNGGVWNCTSVERVIRSGLTMHAPVPANLGSDTDPDGDGVTGDPSRSDLLTVEWHTDGTFFITLHRQ
jgi:hypothetical protein